MTALVERHGSTAPGPQPAAPPASPRWWSWPARSSARRWLAACARLGAVEVVEASSLAEARARALGTQHPDLAVVDSNLPDGSGIALVRELRGLGWVRGLVLSSTEDPYTVRAALAGGVRAFLVTSSAAPACAPARPRRWPPAPGRPGSPAPRRCPAARSRCSSWSPTAAPTRRSARRLGLSALTVKSHLARIARKLGTGDRAEMVVVAMRAGVVV